MIKFLKNFSHSLRQVLSLHTVNISFEKKNLIFYIQDHAQLQPYTYTPEELSDFNIIKNVDPSDSYVIGYVTNFYNTEKLKYSHFHLDNDRNISLRTDASSEDTEISGKLWTICNRKEIMGNCKGDLIRDLLHQVYLLGKHDGAMEYKKMLDANAIEEDDSNHNAENIIELHKITNFIGR